MIRLAIQLVALVGLVASCAWFWLEPGPEPTVAVIAAIGTLLSTLTLHKPWFRQLRQKLGRLHDRALQLLLGPRYRPIDSVAGIEFSWPPTGAGRHQEVIARLLKTSSGVGERVALTHFGSHSGGYDFCIFEGHTVEFELRDFDGDGEPELAVTYHCGAHTMVFRLFRLEYGTFVPVPGAEIGSDWPEISWRDDDKDGKSKIFTMNRHWSGVPMEEWVEERYVFRGDRYKPDREYRKVVSALEEEKRHKSEEEKA